MPQLHSRDFACSQLGSPGASLEGSWGLLGPFLGHLWGIWGPFGDVFGPWQGHLEAFWGLLGLCLRPLSAVPGAACRLLENSNESGMTWGWGGVGGAGFRSRLGPWMTYTRGLPIPKVIRATSQQVKKN